MNKGARLFNGGKALIACALKTINLGMGTGFSEPLSINTRISSNSDGIVFFYSHNETVFLPGRGSSPASAHGLISTSPL